MAGLVDATRTLLVRQPLVEELSRFTPDEVMGLAVFGLLGLDSITDVGPGLQEIVVDRARTVTVELARERMCSRMPPRGEVAKVSDTKAQVSTVVSCRSLRDADAWSEALLKDLSTESGLGDAYRGLGLTRVSFWVQRNPDAAVVMWEGTDTDTLFERISASRNPVLGKWRGLFRVWSGPEEADSYWDASRHKLLSWVADEQGADSEVTIHRDPAQVEEYRQFCLDLQQDPSLMSVLGEVRQRQGFTRVEVWHQRLDGNDLVLVLREAHDLNAAMAQLLAEDNDFDKRVMKMLRASLLQQSSPPPPAKLLTRWHA